MSANERSSLMMKQFLSRGGRLERSLAGAFGLPLTSYNLVIFRKMSHHGFACSVTSS